jgi:hypothetical protein
MSQSNHQLPYKAYARLSPQESARTGSAGELLDTLLDTVRQVESPLLCDMKPIIALALSCTGSMC